MPPPPVGGAAVGNGLGDGLGVADGDAGRLGVADGDAGRLGVAEGLALALGVVTPAVPPGWIVGVAEPVTPGENVVGVAAGEDPVQAETDAEARTVKVAQPAASLALSPVPAIARILMGPPHASGRWRTRFRVPASEEKSRVGPVAARAD